MTRTIHLNYDPTDPTRPKRGKYLNLRIKDGATGQFLGSLAEQKHIGDLRLLERAGVICDLETDKAKLRYPCTVNGLLVCTYEADARYTDVASGQVVVEDVKGGQTTPMFRLKKKLVRAVYGIEIVEVR